MARKNLKRRSERTSDVSELQLAELVEESMLEQAATLHAEMRQLKQEDAGRDRLTFLQRPYAKSQPREAVRKATTWFTAYLPSVIGREHRGDEMRPLETLCDLDLWSCFAELGVNAVHTGPVMKAGGRYLDGTPYPSIDGWFDPSALEIDPELGSERDYSRLVWIAENMPGLPSAESGAVVIGDIVPGHTGMGADFHLALRGFDYYPGLFVLARVDQVLEGNDKRSRNLSKEQMAELLSGFSEQGSDPSFTRLLTEEEVDWLTTANVIPGRPQRPMGPQAGFGWSITKEIEGVPDENGIRKRRWVYLHFFHPKQPTLNFFDPGYAAWRLVTGQLNYIIWDLHSTGVRLDANAFLGIEPKKRDAKAPPRSVQTWSEAHPLSQVVTNMLAWQARRLGGFSFQEMNMAIPDIASSGEHGPDLAYDFITRPACEHALLTGDTSLLSFMYAEMKKYGVDPGSLVHALQNHDEFTYELVHLVHLEQSCSAEGKPIQAHVQSSETIRAEMRREALHRNGTTEDLQKRLQTSFYNKESPNGLCTTVAGLVAAKLGCKTLEEAYERKTDIRRGHLLLAAFNALQPGAFALSGWDLTGALPVEEERVPSILLNAGPALKPDSEKDYRWVNRGAYRLLKKFGSHGADRDRSYGCLNLPEARTLYGPMDEQRLQPSSFYSQLRRILTVRSRLHVATGELAGIMSGGNGVLFSILTELTDFGDENRPYALLLINFAGLESRAGNVSVDIRSHLEEHRPKLAKAFVAFEALRSDDEHMTEYNPADAHSQADSLQQVEPWGYKLLHIIPV